MHDSQYQLFMTSDLIKNLNFKPIFLMVNFLRLFSNKDEKIHNFALSALIGKLLEREREIEIDTHLFVK